MKTNKTILGLLSIASVAGCGALDELDKARRLRPNDMQTDSLVDIIDMGISIAGVMDDPEGADNRDLYDTIRFRHFFGMATPSCLSGDRMEAPAMTAGPTNARGESCVQKDGKDDGHVIMKDCVIRTPSETTCLFNLDATKTEIMEGGEVVRNDYAGTLGLGGPMYCPTLDLTIGFSMFGPIDDPYEMNGECLFGEDDGDLNNYTGSIAFTNAGMVDGCDRLSRGGMSVGVRGLYWGVMLDKNIGLSFHDDPCGDMSLDTDGPDDSCEMAVTEAPMEGGGLCFGSCPLHLRNSGYQFVRVEDRSMTGMFGGAAIDSIQLLDAEGAVKGSPTIVDSMIGENGMGSADDILGAPDANCEMSLGYAALSTGYAVLDFGDTPIEPGDKLVVTESGCGTWSDETEMYRIGIGETQDGEFMYADTIGSSGGVVELPALQIQFSN